MQTAVVCGSGDVKHFVFALFCRAVGNTFGRGDNPCKRLPRPYFLSGILKRTMDVVTIVDLIIESCISFGFGFVNTCNNNVHALHTNTYSSVLQSCAHYFGFPEAVQIAYGNDRELEFPFTNSNNIYANAVLTVPQCKRNCVITTNQKTHKK